MSTALRSCVADFGPRDDAFADLGPFMATPTPTAYALCGVVVHVGHSMRAGHYYAYVKAANGAWHLMDDDRATSASLQARRCRRVGVRC